MKTSLVGPSAPSRLVQEVPYLAFVKENIDMLITMIKELGQLGNVRGTPKKLSHDGSESGGSRSPLRSQSLDGLGKFKTKSRDRRSRSHLRRSNRRRSSLEFEYGSRFHDTYEDLSVPYKRPKPMPFTSWITTILRLEAVCSHIKGVPSVLRISMFMHGHGHPKLAKKMNDKVPKIVDEIFERGETRHSVLVVKVDLEIETIRKGKGKAWALVLLTLRRMDSLPMCVIVSASLFDAFLMRIIVNEKVCEN
ncbi:hypothetical protein Tco_0556770 [Tanacetum coccineum]